MDVQILDAQKCPASVFDKNSHKIIKVINSQDHEEYNNQRITSK
jgi:hypothetical protein